jgi:hypothetical protein
MSVIGACVLSFFNYKVFKNKSWESQSVLTGLYVIKAAMLAPGNMCGPLIYAGLLIQTYSFANMINHRCDTQPGATLPLHCLIAYYTAQQYFLRGSHRDRFSSIQFGKVCPGGIYCGEVMHWMLILFELLAPFILTMYLMPLVIRARIKDAYAHTKAT